MLTIIQTETIEDVIHKFSNLMLAPISFPSGRLYHSINAQVLRQIKIPMCRQLKISLNT